MSGPRNSPVDDQNLTRTLSQRADDFARLGGHDLDLAQVVSRAGEIQRGRRMRASIVMAAVLVAIAVPVGITALSTDNPGKPAPPPLAATPTPDTSPIRIGGDLTAGQPPRYGYSKGINWIAPAERLDLAGPNGDAPRHVAVIDGGVLVDHDDGGGLTASFVDSSGKTLNSWPSTGGFAVSYDGKVAAFVQPDGTVVAVQDAGSRWFEVGKSKLPTLPDGEDYTVDAVWATNCSGRSEETSCEIYVHSSGPESKAYVTVPNHDPVVDEHGFRRIESINSSDVVAGLISTSDEGTCSGVRDGTAMLWQSCDYEPISFSPSGDYLLARPAQHDGQGDTRLAILRTTTGDVVQEFAAGKDVFLQQQVWDDSFHVLASVYDHGWWEVQRFGVDGSRNVAVGRTADDGSEVSPYQLAVHQ